MVTQRKAPARRLLAQLYLCHPCGWIGNDAAVYFDKNLGQHLDTPACPRCGLPAMRRPEPDRSMRGDHRRFLLPHRMLAPQRATLVAFAELMRACAASSDDARWTEGANALDAAAEALAMFSSESTAPMLDDGARFDPRRRRRP